MHNFVLQERSSVPVQKKLHPSIGDPSFSFVETNIWLQAYFYDANVFLKTFKMDIFFPSLLLFTRFHLKLMNYSALRFALRSILTFTRFI